MDVLKALIDAAQNVSSGWTLAGYVVAVIAVIVFIIIKREERTFLGMFLPPEKLTRAHTYNLASKFILYVFVFLLLVAVGLIGMSAYQKSIDAKLALNSATNSRDVFLNLQCRDNSVTFNGRFDMKIFRPDTGWVPFTGHDGSGTIIKLPKGVNEIPVDQLICENFKFADEPPATGNLTYKISAENRVIIPVVSFYSQPAEPSKEQILKMMAAASPPVTEKDVLANTIPMAADRDAYKVWFDNQSGNKITIWGYDCTYCYKDPFKGEPIISPPFTDWVRFDTEKKQRLEFQYFSEAASTSGYFAVFVCHREKGKPILQPIGVYNFYEKKEIEFKIEPGQSPDFYKVDRVQ